MPVKISKSAAKKIAAFMRDFRFRRSLANLTCCKIDTFKMSKKDFRFSDYKLWKKFILP